MQLKRPWILSAVVLLIGFSHIKSSFNFKSDNLIDEDGIMIMSYNVHLLNLYQWINKNTVPSEVQTFVKTQSPDILCFQEYQSSIALDLNYPYSFNPQSNSKSELVIFSKFKFIKTGVINFPNSANRSIFSDIKIKSDTVRVYNLHLQSTGINTAVKELSSNESDELFTKLSTTFKSQQLQAELVASHMRSSPYKIILCGDFNNTAHSYVYRLLKSNLTDTFESAGEGFGGTYSFDYFPLRIDFILVDPSFEVLNYTKHPISSSDHFPISSRLKL
ncbi:MAG: endonuclease/exonuclease/phosphatase family protein [Bacteroidota bacterium]|nr:endonuclease/exonuclease/phosphatase family protein [Bacteroidota bacterium]